MENKIVANGLYRHFKGGYYTIIGLAKHSETQEELVVYRSCSGHGIWVRPIDMFLEKIVRDGNTIDRFSQVVPA